MFYQPGYECAESQGGGIIAATCESGSAVVNGRVPMLFRIAGAHEQDLIATMNQTVCASIVGF